MATTNENIRQLLEMLDHPEKDTEQEIHDIINRDEDTRETYRLMVEAKRSSRNRQDETPVDVDAAWQRFAKKQYFQSSARPAKTLAKARIFNLQSSIFNLKRWPHPSSVCCWCRASLLPPFTSCGTTSEEI